MRIAMIGLGDIAQKAYLPVLAIHPYIELVLCTRNPHTLDKLSAQYRIVQCCEDYKQVLDYDVDAVMVHAATAIHPEICAFFLNAGIPVFVDKPLANSATVCTELHELAAKKQLPLYVGFNRRHLPILKQHAPEVAQQPSTISHLRWEKHRANLPGQLRQFIFDDFIHPLDSINLFAQTHLDNIALYTQCHGDDIRRIDIQWQHDNTLLSASMDRMHGSTTESITVESENKTLHFNGFMNGALTQNGNTSSISTTDWMPMLETKGFHAMVEDWIAVVKRGELAHSVSERNLASHLLAEAICQRLDV